MSTRRGESSRKRAQKYQNTRVFKNNLYDKTPQIKAINSLHVSGVCERCKSIIDWKIKYKKFKIMKAPGHCTKCLQKCVKHAYHIMCKPCADKDGVCPKCGKQGEVVEPKPTREEQLKLDQEMQEMLKSLPERKRRTFLRFLESKKKKKVKKESEDDGDHKSETSREGEKENESDGGGDETKTGTQDLLAFLQRLKLSCKKDDDFDDFDDLDDSDSDGFGGGSTDEEEEDDDDSESEKK